MDVRNIFVNLEIYHSQFDKREVIMNLSKITLTGIGVLGCVASSTAQISSQISIRSWHRFYTDSLQGTRSEEALQWLKANKRKVKPVIVAIVDTGLDSTTSELRQSLLLNRRERIDTKDNDRNGYVDDLYGWNLLGTADGKLELTSVGREEYREFKRLYPKYKHITKEEELSSAARQEYEYYLSMRKMAGIDRYLRLYELTLAKTRAYAKMDSLLRIYTTEEAAREKLSVQHIMSLKPESVEWISSAEMILPDLLKADSSSTWGELKHRHNNQYTLIRSRVEGIERDVDKRTLLGDDMSKGSDRYYGNPNFGGKGSEHGTFVASLICGAGRIDSNIRGVYPSALILPIKAVPDNGDEYDKDVSIAIRYAVDRGARIINLSLGKYVSPSAQLVNEAMAYARERDVLIVHSSGNNGYRLDLMGKDKRPYFPTGRNAAGQQMDNYLRIGSVGKRGERTKFSNYGASIDLYAPGVEIWGVMPGDKLESSQGTSLSAPIVSGIAAMLRAYYPRLKAREIREILIASARTMAENKVDENPHQPILPIVDAWRAVQYAEAKSQGKVPQLL